MHYEKHLMNSAFISDLVIGMSDGLTVPFALAAGLSSAVHNNDIIVTAGFAEIIAGSIAMGLGGFLAGQTAVEHYDSELKKEYWEIDEFPEVEIREVKEIFQGMGLSEKTQELAVHEMIKDKDNWVNFMMKYELGLEKPDKNRARKSAFNIGFAYIAGGTIPLLSYVFTETPESGFKLSFVVTVICLMIFGFYKSKVTGQNPIMGALKVTFIGVVAALAAYFLVKAFG
jgi:VIT1/CCC1 family predicted Fe2+/Mn2+ transporter